MVIILIDFMFREAIFEYELDIIVKFREVYQHNLLYHFCSILVKLTEINTIKILCIILYFCTDPMLAFKTGLLTYIAIYLITTLKILYAIPRPFWLDYRIDTDY